MKNKLLFFLLLVFSLPQFSFGQCPIDCSTLMSSIQITTVPIAPTADTGEGCSHQIIFSGLTEIPGYDSECFKFQFLPTGTNPLTVELDNAALHTYKTTIQNPTNDPVEYQISVIPYVNGLPCGNLTETVSLGCCIQYGDTGVDIIDTQIDCITKIDPNTGEDFEVCVYKLLAEGNNIEIEKVDWQITRPCNEGVGSISQGSNPVTVEFRNCDAPNIVKVVVHDIYGCQYQDEIEITCYGCDPYPCEEVEPITGVDVDVNKERCVQDPYTGIYFCKYNFQVLNPNPDFSYVWVFIPINGTQGYHGGIHGPSGSAISTSIDNVVLTLTVINEDGCVVFTQEILLPCEGEEKDCEEADCRLLEGVDLTFEVDITPTLVSSECQCDGYGTKMKGLRVDCNYRISIDSLPAGWSSFIRYNTATNLPTERFFGSHDLIDLSCGFGTLAPPGPCGICFTVDVFNENGCLIDSKEECVQCPILECAFTCGQGGGGGEGGFSEEDSPATDSKSILYPNPIQLSVDNTLRFANFPTIADNQTTKIDLIGLSGKIMQQETITPAWDNTMQLETISPGIYFIRISDGTQILQVEKIVILE